MDRSGAPVIDPTQNVTALVIAAQKRFDDLMDAADKRIDDRLLAVENLAKERHQRGNDLRELEARHMREMLTVQSQFEVMLRDKETQRIDAIRAVDVGAVARASEVATAQAMTLATQVQVSAETLRNQVALSAQAAAAALAQALEPIQKSIEDLRKTQFEQAGAKSAQVEGKGNNQWVIGTAIGIAFFVISTVISITIVLSQRGS